MQQVQELILKKQEILKSKYENYWLERDKGNLKYEDLFIDSENVEIKFYNYKVSWLGRLKGPSEGTQWNRPLVTLEGDRLCLLKCASFAKLPVSNIF